MGSRFLRARTLLLHALLVLLAALLPVAIALLLIRAEADQLAHESSDEAAQVVIRQADAILAQAMAVSDHLLPLAGRPCAETAPRLRETSGLLPHLHAVLIAPAHPYYCSGQGAMPRAPLDALLHDALPAESDGHALLVVQDSPIVPGQPALLVVRSQADGRRVLVALDGRYLLNFLGAAAPAERYRLAVTARGHDGALRRGTGGAEAAGTRGRLAYVATIDSQRFPYAVQVGVRASLLAERSARLLHSYAPVIVLCSLGLGLLMRRVLKRQLSMAAEIRRGIARGEFHVQYQPVVALDSGRCVGVEALMRWNRAGMSAVRPDIFFSVAETNHLAVPLTRHLFELVARDLHGRWLPLDFHVGVNITSEHLESPEILDDVARLSQALALQAPRLTLEVTERQVLPGTPAVLEHMRRLRAAGVRLAIDDFGTGHSALAYLERFPVDYLKIDRLFVSAIGTGAVNAPVLDLIIALAARLGVALVAEGIEDASQAAYLRAEGVDFGQGFLFAPPMPADALVAWLESQAAASGGAAPPGHATGPAVVPPLA